MAKEKFQKQVPCYKCGEAALLKEEVSWMTGVHRAYVRCAWCDLAFIANFNDQEWAKLTNGV